jgi:hypothetical protein
MARTKPNSRAGRVAIPGVSRQKLRGRVSRSMTGGLRNDARLSASERQKLAALTPQQRLAVEDALAFFPHMTLDEILSELSLLT